ncbi:hypothetical protein SR870_20045 [Rhodopseudomonas palustris]|uniref:hypothetical protein n=1 Tax=Rhodopseudomonas palustris TaxID=1076 RepID=UPI002ACE688C|nr:hypothetical protein [Rhodopseudomonas palustris]WQG98949.1 hypothetical protein SR870_20045 [Rhodopseudomonas palustris]
MPQTSPTLIDRDDRPQPLRRARTARPAMAMVASLIAASSLALPASAQQPAPVIVAPPFIATLSNTTPLAFGMDALQAERALGMPLNYVSGRPGDEIFLAIRTGGGSGFFNRRDRLYLQFRHGRLAGWKGDWGRNWMWD